MAAPFEELKETPFWALWLGWGLGVGLLSPIVFVLAQVFWLMSEGVITGRAVWPAIWTGIGMAPGLLPITAPLSLALAGLTLALARGFVGPSAYSAESDTRRNP
jgi:hypothetical protein